MNNQKKKLEKKPDSRYHNTSLLLRKYREVTWSLEVSVSQSKKAFQREFGQSIEDFLDSVYMAGLDLSGSHLENRAREIQKSSDMLRLIDEAVDILRAKHTQGEEYYWILYYAYLSPQKYPLDQILYLLQPHIRDISRTTYFRKRQKAIELLGSLLWGYEDGETRELLDQFLEQYGKGMGS